MNKPQLLEIAIRKGKTEFRVRFGFRHNLRFMGVRILPNALIFVAPKKMPMMDFVMGHYYVNGLRSLLAFVGLGDVADRIIFEDSEPLGEYDPIEIKGISQEFVPHQAIENK